MANTTNLDLVKPAGTDHALISVLNSNSDKIDAFAGQTNDSLSAEQNGLAYIVGNTNTTGGTLAAGQFVYVKGHSTIAEGLRKVTSSISANGSITTSNTDACSEGGLNALNSKLTKQLVPFTNHTSGTIDIQQYGSLFFINANFGSLSLAEWATLDIVTFTNDLGLTVGAYIPVLIMDGSYHTGLVAEVSSTKITLRNWSSTGISGASVRFSGCFM